MILCLDSGNTRLKWGLYESHVAKRWLAHGALPQADLSPLADLPARWTAPHRILLANVAGPGAAAAITAALAAWPTPMEVLHPTRQAGGVTNGYDAPENLGIDRWCALIGGWQRAGRATVVVMAGTATTIDTLDDRGHFLGGLILPGIDLMRRALHHDTATLPLANGQWSPHPRNTGDAITTGILEAQAGAIERAIARLPSPALIISGGHAPTLLPYLTGDRTVVDCLPLEGILALAAPGA